MSGGRVGGDVIPFLLPGMAIDREIFPDWERWRLIRHSFVPAPRLTITQFRSMSSRERQLHDLHRLATHANLAVLETPMSAVVSRAMASRIRNNALKHKPATRAGLMINGGGYQGKTETACETAAVFEDEWLDLHHQLENTVPGILGTKPVSVEDLRKVPADPAALKKYLLTMYSGQAGPEVEQAGRVDLWLFSVARDLLNGFFPVSQAVQAAAYRMLAELPGVKVIPSTRDPEGRPGSAISITEQQQKRGLVEHRMVFDPATGAFLANLEIAAQPAGQLAGVAPGTPYATYVYLVDVWTDESPRPPAG